jgi:hypothetical protein
VAEQIVAVRAGFWRRAIAFLIDCTIIGLLILIVAPIAFHLTNGRVQFVGSPIKMIQCEALKDLPPRMAPPDFQPNFGSRCQTSIFGWQIADTATIGRSTKQGAATSSIHVTIAVDSSGNALDAVMLDWLFLPLLLSFRWWRDYSGASPGRLVTGMHIASASGERPVQNLKKRYLLVALFFAVGWIFQLAINYAAAFSGFLTSGEPGPVFLLSLTPIVVFLPIVIVPIIRRRDVFYDRWSGTAVVLDEPPAESEEKQETAAPAPQ